MLDSIYAGLSGMNAYSQGLQVISNNVANLNTLGYKSTTVNFTDIFNNASGGLTVSRDSDLSQSGNGVRVSSQAIDFRQGDMRQTQGDLDLAIQGDGFLVLLDDSHTFYTRTGQFELDKDGFISLQGTKNHLGVINEAGQAVPVNIDAKRTNSPSATTKIVFADNISSTGTDATVSDVQVFDSTGAKQVWQIKLHATGSTAPGEWQVTVTDQTNRSVGSGTLKFTGSSVDVSTAQITITDAPPNADPLSVVLDFSGGVTSFSSGTTSTIRAASTDGNAVGALSKVTVNDDGKIELAYSNTKTEVLGAVAVADFRDPEKLERVGSGLFVENGAGTRRLLPSGTDGIGKLVSKQLEASNVDLSAQFGDLILIQRGFQASSQVVSVSNDMIQQLFGIRSRG